MAGIKGILPTYEIKELRSVRQIKELFPEGYEERNNWFFVSMQGYHGTHLTLDKIEAFLEDAPKDVDSYWVTILIVQPRLCNLFYGEIPVKLKDIPYLRSLVKKTVDVIPQTQKGNI